MEPTPPTRSSAAEAVSMAISMLEDVNAALAGANDCAGRAQVLRTWQGEHEARLASVRSALKAHAPETLKPEVEKQLTASAGATALFDQARRCLADADFADAWEAISAVMD